MCGLLLGVGVTRALAADGSLGPWADAARAWWNVHVTYATELRMMHSAVRVVTQDPRMSAAVSAAALAWASAARRRLLGA